MLTNFPYPELAKCFGITAYAIGKFYRGIPLSEEEQYYFNRFSYAALAKDGPAPLYQGLMLGVNGRKWLHVNGMDDDALEGMNFCNLLSEYGGYYNMSAFSYSYSNFMNLNLAGSNFSDLTVVGSNFAFTNIKNADLSKSIVFNSIFINADLSNSNVNSTELTLNDFEFAKLEGVNIAEASFFHYNSVFSTNFTGSDLAPEQLFANNYNPGFYQFNQQFKEDVKEILIAQANNLTSSLPNDPQLPKLNQELKGFGTVLMEKLVELIEHQNKIINTLGETGNYEITIN